MIVEINRTYEPEATIGTLIVGGEVLGFTLERCWLGNRKNISCISTGSYICKKHDSPTFGKVYKVCDVYQRSNILFHVGNVIEDTEGCILIGSSVGYIDDKRAVTGSRIAFDSFIRELDGVDEFKLIIK